MKGAALPLVGSTCRSPSARSFGENVATVSFEWRASLARFRVLYMHANNHAAVILILLFCLFQVAGAKAEPSGSGLPTLGSEDFAINRPRSPIALRARLELGALGVLAHHIQYGAEGTRVDYRDDADQNTLFFFWRISAELEIRRRHTLVLLYQPLNFDTQAVLDRKLDLGLVTFPSGQTTRFGYGFDFYRIVYQYDVFADARRELGFGGGFQVRNARVSFVTANGETGFADSNLGIVPLLRIRGRYVFDNALYLESELDGWISPIPGQGRRGDVAFGAIADLSLRAGAMVRSWFEVFLTLRYLGGGYRGDGDDDNPLLSDKSRNSNWLHTMIFSVGIGLR